MGSWPDDRPRPHPAKPRLSAAPQPFAALGLEAQASYSASLSSLDKSFSDTTVDFHLEKLVSFLPRWKRRAWTVFADRLKERAESSVLPATLPRH